MPSSPLGGIYAPDIGYMPRYAIYCIEDPKGMKYDKQTILYWEHNMSREYSLLGTYTYNDLSGHYPQTCKGH